MSYSKSPAFPTPERQYQSEAAPQFQEDAQLLVNAYLPPPPYETSQQPSTFGTAGGMQFEKPFCLPQISSSYDAPFARGYNPDLRLSQSEFLAFVDGLNLAIVASPPLRVVDMAGMALGFVPYHWAIIAGIAMQTAARTGMHVLSKTLTDRYLRTANKRLFRPRGLVARLYTTTALSYLLAGTTNPESSGKQKMESVGRGVGKVLLRLPIPFAGRIIRAIADKPPTVQADPSGGSDKDVVVRRRLALVEGLALPVDLNVPEARTPQGAGAQIQSLGLKLDQWKSTRTQQKVERHRSEMARQESSGNYNRRAARRQRRAQKKGLIGTVLGLEPKGTKLERKVAKADLLEHWNTRNVLWVVVMDASEEHVEDIGLAEDEANEEIISQDTWQSEMKREEEMYEDSDSDSDEEPQPHTSSHRY